MVAEWLDSLRIREAEPANAALGMVGRVCLPIRFNAELLGYLWLVDEPEPLSAAARGTICNIAPMQALQQMSFREQAAQVIRADIIAGELRGGEIYSAVALAEKLGVSPTPVREALLDLANIGLVEAVRNRGFRILTPDDRDLDEIGELRLMLEVPATRKVAERASDADLRLLELAVKDIESAAESGDLAAYVLADRAFHIGLLELTGNQRLARLVGQLRDQTRLVGLKELFQSGHLMASTGEHRQILEALQRRDADAAEELMRVHITHTRGIWAGRSETTQS